MRRRPFLTAGLLFAAAPVAVRAQGGKVFRVGVLTGGQREPFWSIFRNTLKDLGYVEGTNIKFEYRSAEFVPSRLDALAAELVALNVDVLVAVQTPAALAAKKATRTIPILLAGVGDAVATGLVASLARPEANLTGVSTATSELAGKSVELLKEILPAARRIAAIANAPDPFHKPLLEQLEKAGSQAGIAIERVMIEREADLEPGIQYGLAPPAAPNAWRHLFGPEGGDAPFFVRNAVDFFDIRLEQDASAEFPAREGRDLYFYVFSGRIAAGDHSFAEGEQGLQPGGGTLSLRAEAASLVVAFLVDPAAPVTRKGTVGDNPKIPPAFAIRALRKLAPLRRLWRG